MAAKQIAVQEHGVKLNEDLKGIARDLRSELDRVFKPLIENSEHAMYALLALDRSFPDHFSKYLDSLCFDEIVKKEYARASYAGLEEFMKLRNELDHGLNELEKLGMVHRTHGNGHDDRIRFAIDREGDLAVELLKAHLFLHRKDS